jgi:hypothetical protein
MILAGAAVEESKGYSGRRDEQERQKATNPILGDPNEREGV